MGFWWDEFILHWNRWDPSHRWPSQTPTNHPSQFINHYDISVPKSKFLLTCRKQKLKKMWWLCFIVPSINLLFITKYCFLFTVAIVSPQLFINNSRAILFSECVFPRFILVTILAALTNWPTTCLEQIVGKKLFFFNIVYHYWKYIFKFKFSKWE